MKNNWEITDKNGTIHSGTESEMKIGFDLMTLDILEIEERYGHKIAKNKYHEMIAEWVTGWDGDLKLIEIHQICK